VNKKFNLGFPLEIEEMKKVTMKAGFIMHIRKKEMIDRNSECGI
jgi:hypothetical protein